jgi:hypothetical protein
MTRTLSYTIILIGFSLLFLGCDGGSRVEGQIRDTKGRPISGATVKLSVVNGLSSHPTAVTDSEGRYKTSITHAPSKVSLSLTVEKPGYNGIRKEFYSGDNPMHVDIVLDSDSAATK